MLRITDFLSMKLVDESTGLGGSFKSRGVAQQIQAYARCELGKPIVTFTSGNHGVAVALLARRVDQVPTVIVPQWVEQDKWSLLVRLGCRVIKAGRTASECERVAQEISLDIGGYLAHPYRSSEQIRGYTTLWSEIAQVFPDGADIIVPVGSGGLLAAGVLYRSETNARYHIVGAEPTECPSLARSLSLGRTARVRSRSLTAPALNVDETPGEVFGIVNSMAGVDMFQVTDEEIAMTTSFMEAHGMLVDPGAATGMAVALFRTVSRRHKHLVVILTGAGARLNLARFESEGLLRVSQRDLVRSLGCAGDCRGNSRTANGPRNSLSRG